MDEPGNTPVIGGITDFGQARLNTDCRINCFSIGMKGLMACIWKHEGGWCYVYVCVRACMCYVCLRPSV